MVYSPFNIILHVCIQHGHNYVFLVALNKLLGPPSQKLEAVRTYIFQLCIHSQFIQETY